MPRICLINCPTLHELRPIPSLSKWSSIKLNCVCYNKIYIYIKPLILNNEAKASCVDVKKQIINVNKSDYKGNHIRKHTCCMFQERYTNTFKISGTKQNSPFYTLTKYIRILTYYSIVAEYVKVHHCQLT